MEDLKIQGKSVKPPLNDGSGSTFLSDPLYWHPAFLPFFELFKEFLAFFHQAENAVENPNSGQNGH
jgi:hypothetical protein